MEGGDGPVGADGVWRRVGGVVSAVRRAFGGDRGRKESNRERGKWRRGWVVLGSCSVGRVSWFGVEIYWEWCVGNRGGGGALERRRICCMGGGWLGVSCSLAKEGRREFGVRRA